MKNHCEIKIHFKNKNYIKFQFPKLLFNIKPYEAIILNLYIF